MDTTDEIAMSEGGDESEPLMEPVEEPMNDDAEPMIVGVSSSVEATETAESKEPDPYTGRYEWNLTNFRRLSGKQYSESFEIGTYPWRLLMFPRGNNSPHLSLYLDVPEHELQPFGWCRKASFKLTLVNQYDSTKSIHKEATHTFRDRQNDWGFTTFVPLADLDADVGLLVDDTLRIVCEVSVEKPWDLLHDSKKETGFVGLKNQGATCYLNSWLQCLYTINYFRQAVFHIPTTEEDEPSKSIPLALQSLFYKLQFGTTSVSTKDLTKSFGWDTYGAFMQEDVHEFNKILCSALEEKMKGTKVEGVINKLFEGHIHKFIQCINVDFKSTKRDSYMDIFLDVKGCKNIYDSFDKLCVEERLEGANQYKAEGHGLQDAKIGDQFDSFPPVLQLHLKRFEYDFQRDMRVKINDRYEFYEELDLDAGEGKYLTGDADKAVRNKYKLHSVLVHSGGTHGGHYYTYIRPDGTQWLKFDDEKVTKEDSKKAVDEQWGGEDENPSPAPGYNNAPTFKFTKYSNAYMLVYVRESDWDSIMCNVTEDDIAEHLRARLKAEQEEKERKRKEKQEAHLYTIIKVARDEDLAAQIGHTRFFDLVDHDKVTPFRVRKQTLFGEFKEQVAAEWGVPVARQRYWLWAKRQNNTFRPSRPLTQDDDSFRVMDVGRTEGGLQPKTNLLISDVKLYLEVLAEVPRAPQPLMAKPAEIILFFKVYDPAQQAVRYAGHFFALRSMTTADLAPAMAALAGWPRETAVEVYEEIKFEPTLMVEPLPPRSTMTAAQLEDGDILCFQRTLQPGEEQEYKLPRVKDYFAYVLNRLVVLFKQLDLPKDEGFELELAKSMSYEAVGQALAAHLGLEDPARLRFTQHNPYSQLPKPHPMKWNCADSLEEMLTQGFYGQHLVDTLYYEVLDIPLPDFERLKTLKVVLHNERAEEVSTHSLRLPKESCVGEVLQELARQVGAPYTQRPMRLLEVFYSKIYKVFDPAEKIDQINDQYWVVRAEAVPEEEEDLPPSTKLIHVYHFSTDQYNNHVSNFGDPFLMAVAERETLAQVAPRIQARLGVSDADFAKWKFAYVNTLRPPEYLEAEDVVAAKFLKAQPLYHSGDSDYLGLEHADANPRRTYQRNNRAVAERPMKIGT